MSRCRECEKLDTYLSGELAPDDNASFERHLAACSVCREAIDEQRWIDGLLRSPVLRETESPEPTLALSICEAVARQRRRRLVLSGAAAAAAVVFMVVGWVLRLEREALQGGNTAARVSEKSVTPAVFIGSDDLIVVPVESRHPNVTVVRVYPVYQPNNIVRSSAEFLPNVDDLDSDSELNGG